MAAPDLLFHGDAAAAAALSLPAPLLPAAAAAATGANLAGGFVLTPQASYVDAPLARGSARYTSHASPFADVHEEGRGPAAYGLGVGGSLTTAERQPSALSTVPGGGGPPTRGALSSTPQQQQLSTSEYLANFYSDLLVETDEDAEDAFLRTAHQELEIRKRMYSLANADMFRVRFLEEARWELRERQEVIARMERLERSRLETALIAAIRELTVRGGGSWCEEARRESLLLEEEMAWRDIDAAQRTSLKQHTDALWDRHLLEEDRWRWDIELAVRHGMHTLQMDEHKHRSYLETELYPANLNKLLHAMELEWVKLLESQVCAYRELIEANLTNVMLEEEDCRAELKKYNKRIFREFHVLHQMLELQNLEVSERQLVLETSDRLFSIIFNRERVQRKALQDRSKLLEEVVFRETAERPADDTPGSPVREGSVTYQRKLQMKELDLNRKTCELDRQLSESFLKDQQLRQRLAEIQRKEHLLASKLQELQQAAVTPAQ